MGSDNEIEDEEYSQAYRDLCQSAMDLMVSVGIISSIRDRWSEEAQENWQQEITDMKERLDAETANVQQFASAFD